MARAVQHTRHNLQHQPEVKCLLASHLGTQVGLRLKDYQSTRECAAKYYMGFGAMAELVAICCLLLSPGHIAG